MKHALIRYAVILFRLTRIYRVLCPFFRGKGVILAMHRVVQDTGRQRIDANSRIEISPKFLEALLGFFRTRGYEAVSMDGVFERLMEGSSGRPFVCFTLDDGYIDVYDTVYPLFRRQGIPLTVYITTSFPDRKAVLWWYMLEDLILAGKDEVRIHVGGKSYSFPAGSPREKENAFNGIREIFMKIPQEDAPKVLTDTFSRLGISPEAYDSSQMEWKHIIEMSRDPLVNIGAHTVNHFNLRQLEPSRVRQEILDSKLVLEAKIGCPVDHFAYPFGSRLEAGPREFEMARACGFKTAVTMREGAVFPEHRSYTHCLPRIEITGRHQDLTLVDMRRCGVVSLFRNGLRQRVVTC